MRVLYAVTCEHAEPRQDGRLDMHGIFHQLFAPGFPAKQERMVMALAIEWDEEGEGRREFKIDMMDPSRSPCLTISGHTDVSPRRAGEAPPQTRLILPMEEVIFPVVGTYLFELLVGEDRRTLAPMHLIENPGAG